MTADRSSIQAIVLAAGAGSRFGGAKLLAPWRGRSLVCASVEAALAAPVDEVIVVLGCDAALVAQALQSGPEAARLRIAVAEDWAQGLAASLRAGLAALPKTSKGCLIFLGDMPATPCDLPSRLVAALTDGAIAAQPEFEGAPAHPVALSAALYPALRALEGDAGAGRLLRTLDGVVRLKTGDPGAVFDIDVADDLSDAAPFRP